MITTLCKKTFLSIILFLAAAAIICGEDIFQFNAPPVSVYLNASFEQSTTETISIKVEHEGAAIPEWYIAATKGSSSVYTPRTLVFSSNTMAYQLYKSSPGSNEILMAPPDALGASNVISTTDFNNNAAVMEQKDYSLYFYIEQGQFIPAGTYTDTITLTLYIGDYSDAIADTIADSVVVTVYGRMAQLLDIYSIREPGIRFMDLTIVENDKLIATVNERSNSATGYTVSITSKNLANDGGGETEPYFLHSDSAGLLNYSLTYDGAAPGAWSSGTTLLTDSNNTTYSVDSIWISKELRISYTGSPNLPAGDYEDILTLTISAK